MKRIRILLAILSLHGCTADKTCKTDSLTILYDRGDVLRIVSPKSGDLIRWSANPEAHFLSRMVLRDADSVRLFERFLKTVRTDSSVRILTATEPFVLNPEDAITISFYPDRNDLNADAMIVYHYRECSRSSDTLFLGATSAMMRFNAFRASGDTLLLDKIRSFLWK